MFIGSWKFGTKKMNPPLISSILTLNWQELDYIYIPIGYIYVVIVLHKKDNWANKSCIYAYFNLHSYSYAKICLWLPIVYMCITYSFFLCDPVIIKGSSSYFIRLVRSRSRFIYAQNRDVSSMCGLLLKFSW